MQSLVLVFQTKRISDRHHPVAGAHSLGSSERHKRQFFIGFDPDHGNICFFIHADNFCLIFFFVRGLDLNFIRLRNNVIIGEDSIIVALGGIAGSTTLGTGVVLGGQVAVAGHLTIGDRVMAAGRTGIHASLPAKVVVSGFPAISHQLWLRISSLLIKLPELVKDVRALKKQMAEFVRK